MLCFWRCKVNITSLIREQSGCLFHFVHPGFCPGGKHSGNFYDSCSCFDWKEFWKWVRIERVGVLSPGNGHILPEYGSDWIHQPVDLGALPINTKDGDFDLCSVGSSRFLWWKTGVSPPGGIAKAFKVLKESKLRDRSICSKLKSALCHVHVAGTSSDSNQKCCF